MLDAAQGFYTTYRTLFDLISDEEVTNGSKLDYPSFGSSTSVWFSSPAQASDIRAFYNGWLNFATEKDFAWKDQYRVEEGMDRMMKRAIEKENQRERRTGRREYNECVRVSSSIPSPNRSVPQPLKDSLAPPSLPDFLEPRPFDSSSRPPLRDVPLVPVSRRRARRRGVPAQGLASSRRQGARRRTRG